jgi:excinuclease ABC subunit A
MKKTSLRGARTNNLQGVDLDLTPGTLIGIAGPSGAGKSSLAFGTLYAEGQRRYVESFSAYARQFLERLPRPPVDLLEPVAAGIAVDRQAPVRTSRSTVGTMTEIADYAKSLWARTAVLHCRQCGEVVGRDNADSAAARVIKAWPGVRCVVTYPVEIADATAFVGVRDSLAEQGYRRVRVAGEVRDIDTLKPSDLFEEAASKKKASAKKAPAKKVTAKAMRRLRRRCARWKSWPIAVLRVRRIARAWSRRLSRR